MRSIALIRRFASVAHASIFCAALVAGLLTEVTAQVTLQSTCGRVGSKVGILGEGFDSSSVVKFNGTAATRVLFKASTYLVATVPAGATDGYVTVTTGATTLTSTQKYVVHNSWGKGAPMPTAVFFPEGVGVLKGKIYVVGGFTNGDYAAVTDNQIYNPVTNTWRTGASFPTLNGNGASAVVNNVLYVFGGANNGNTAYTNAVWAYSPTTDTWSAKSAMPTARGSAGAVVDGGMIYVIGGWNGISRLNTVEKYDPATDTWTEEAPLLEGKSEPSVALVGSTIVAADGYDADDGENEGYDVSTNSWRSLASDPTARNGACGGSIGSQFYVAGGYQAGPPGSPALRLNESFNLTANKWTTQAPLPQASLTPGSVVANGQLYCFGGVANSYGLPLKNVQIYQP